MSLLNEIEKNKDLRKIFGERELVIIRKQLLGVRLKPSEKTRLSRDIKKKLWAVNALAPYVEEFDLKKSKWIKDYIDMAIEDIKEDHLFGRIKKILLFGSTVDNTRTFRSDIDIAVVFNKINSDDAFKFRIRASRHLPDKVDIQVYNVLPEKVKKSINKNHKVLYKKDG